MTREEAIEWMEVKRSTVIEVPDRPQGARELIQAYDMAIEALQAEPTLQEVVRCKDCRHANECHKSVQYTRNEQNTVTIGYSPIEWCSKGERKEE